MVLIPIMILVFESHNSVTESDHIPIQQTSVTSITTSTSTAISGQYLSEHNLLLECTTMDFQQVYFNIKHTQFT